jgi:PIN domain
VQPERPLWASGPTLARCHAGRVLPRVGVQANAIIKGLDYFMRRAYDYPDSQGLNAASADNYVAWANGLERDLREWFSDVPLGRIYTERFWRVSLQQSSRLPEMLRLEAGLQVEWLSEVRKKVERMAARFSPPGAVAVLDTNVLLHFKPLDEIDWETIIGASPVRLVVPLGVVDELDQKKTIRGKLGERSKTRARLLDQHVFGGSGVRTTHDPGQSSRDDSQLQEHARLTRAQRTGSL